MKYIFSFLILTLVSLQSWAHDGDKLIRMQKKQERIIERAYKKGDITRREYQKLLSEQKTIKRYIDLADMDNYWSSAELNRINGKLQRAQERLKRYENNSEVY